MKAARRPLRVAAAALPLLLLGLAGPDSPVADAAARGDIEEVRTLLRAGADVNAPHGDGMTALHWAAERGEASLAEVLIHAGADVQAGTRIGRYTPLHLAARSAGADLVELLVASGADPNARTTNSGATPLHLAAGRGDLAVIRALVRSGADVEAREGAWDQTPLIFAASRNRVEGVRALLEAGADPAVTSRVVDVVEQAEADRAAERRLSELLQEFKKREGGGPDWHPTPSQVQAAIEASREVQRKWPDVPRPGEDEASSSAEASEPAAGQEPEAPETKSDEPTDSSEAAGEAPEHQEEGEEDDEPRPMSYAEMVGTWGGLTPLLHAVRQGHVETTLALLDAGADVNQASAGDGTTPLLMAAVNGQFDLALTLLDRGADPNASSAAGATPLFAVLERTWAPRASYAHPTEHQRQEATHLDVMESLLQAGADPNVRLESHLWYMEYTFGVLRGSGIDMKGATPFWRAAYALDVNAMRLLKEHGADPHIPTMKPPERRRRPPAEPEKPAEDEPPEGEGEEASGEEAEDGNPKKGNAEGESAEVEEGPREAQNEEEDHSGIPPVPVGGPAIYPIHAAAGVGYGQSFAGNAHRYVPDNWLAAVRFLVEECGADVNARDANAYTPLHHAASRGDNEVVRYLVERGADVTALSRKGQTTADMANGPVQRVQPFPSTVALLEELGSKNNHACVSC